MKTFNHVNSKSIKEETIDYNVISKMFIVVSHHRLETNDNILLCPKFFKDVMGDFKID